MMIFQIQLPVVRNDGKPGDTAHIIDSIVEWTGGATVTEAMGLWQDSTGKVIRDTVLNVQTYATLEQVNRMRAYVALWAAILDQDALVTAVWTADVQFVSGK